MAFDVERKAIRQLLDEHNPADAIATYYAIHHPQQKTQLEIFPGDGRNATGYVSLSRTGLDIFRPLVTMRLPEADANAAAEQLFSIVAEGTPVILYAPAAYEPLLQAFFEIQTVEKLHLFTLDRSRFEPIINIHVTQSAGPNDLPRFVISSPQDRSQVGAVSGLNWQSPYFAELFVNTSPGQRRQGWGRSVLAAAVQHVLDSGRSPLYVASEQNEPSKQLAQKVGFVDSQVRLIFAQAQRRKSY